MSVFVLISMYKYVIICVNVSGCVGVCVSIYVYLFA